MLGDLFGASEEVTKRLDLVEHEPPRFGCR